LALDSGFLSASADKSVKFWEWRLVDVEDLDDDGVAAEGGGTRRELGVAHVKTLQMAEDVLSVKVGRCKMKPVLRPADFRHIPPIVETHVETG